MSEARARGVPWGRLGVEFLVIVTGVLLALGVDEWREGRADRRLADEVLQVLGSELEENRDQLERRISYHESVLPALDSLMRLAASPAAPGILEGDALPQGLGFYVMRRTSWELAQVTEVVRHLDLGLAELLSVTYTLQEGLSVTERIILDGAVRPETFAGRDPSVAGFLSFMLGDVLEQERSILRFIDASLDAIRERLGDRYVGRTLEISLAPAAGRRR